MTINQMYATMFLLMACAAFIASMICRLNHGTNTRFWYAISVLLLILAIWIGGET